MTANSVVGAGSHSSARVLPGSVSLGVAETLQRCWILG